MYNERTRQSLASTRAVGAQRSCPLRDIPSLELEERSGGRRSCDGTLRRDIDEAPGYDCKNDSCGGWGLEAHPLAMVYSPCQAWRNAYAPDVALERGTLFAELDLPFEPKNCKRGCSL